MQNARWGIFVSLFRRLFECRSQKETGISHPGPLITKRQDYRCIWRAYGKQEGGSAERALHCIFIVGIILCAVARGGKSPHYSRIVTMVFADSLLNVMKLGEPNNEDAR